MKYTAKKKSGLPPGSLVYTGEKAGNLAGIKLFHYSPEDFIEKECATIEESFPYKEKRGITWINIDAINDPSIVEKAGRFFKLHPLTQEDILNPEQRPKVEEFEEYIYIVFKMIYHDASKKHLVSEQISMVLGKGFVITFQEKRGDIFDPVRERIRKGTGRVRNMGADYLAYSLMDSVVDNYFIILERTGEEIEAMEDAILEKPEASTLQAIHGLKRNLLFLRKSLWPLREAINILLRTESKIVDKTSFLYIRDLYDHTVRIIDIIETLRDIASSMLEIYLSSISNKMNEVMKVLTIIATIFIPLTLLAGIYGMNFEFMPELRYRWAYPAVILVMLTSGLMMVLYFKKKKWL